MKTRITIDQGLCNRCNTCLDICPNGIYLSDGEHVITRHNMIDLCISCGQCMAVCPNMAIRVNELDYQKDFFELNGHEVDSEAFQYLIQSRRSVRNFRDKPVPDDLLKQVAEAISYAPPSFPPITTEITIVNGKDKLSMVLPEMTKLYQNLLRAMKNPIARRIVRRQAGIEKFKVIKEHIVPIFKRSIDDLIAGSRDIIIHNAPAMILFHANQDAGNYRTDLHIALTFGLLKAHSIGLGATAIDLIPPAVQKSPSLRELFRIPPGNNIEASMIIGYPKYRYRRGIKRELASVTWI
ncbi:MAG: nitroreductase family protein [Bacteroidales bacterium]|nr:nitroreductase family protein [Bacteroidales bacterium]